MPRKKIEDYTGARRKGLKWAQDLGQRLERCADGSAAKFVAKRLGNGLYLGLDGAVARAKGGGPEKDGTVVFLGVRGAVMTLRFRALVIRDARVFMWLPWFPKAGSGMDVKG